MSPSSRSRAVSGGVAASLLLAACSGASEEPAEGPSSSASASVEPTTTSPAEVALPGGPLGEQVGWVIDVISEDPDAAAPAEADITGRFSAEMLAQVPAADLATVLASLRASGPWVAVASDDDGAGAQLTLAGADGEFLTMQLAIDDAELVTGLLFTPGTDPNRPPAADWEELDAGIDELAGVDASVLVSSVTADGTCDPIHAHGDTDSARPLGSVFKLYVLGAVVAAVEAGTLTWDAPLTLTDDVRSLPSGTLQDQPTGTQVTVLEAATAMISISDNTATDLLVHTVGREAVEQALTDMGHADPALNTPFLTTRDLFWLGWGDTDADDGWAAATTDERRAVLASAPTGVLTLDPGAVTTSRWQDGLDWFATADDLCAAHVALHRMTATDAGAPVTEILSANPGVELPAGLWDYTAFKGGSAPGVLAGTWFVRSADGAEVVVSIQLTSDDPAAVQDPMSLVLPARDALTLAAD